MATRMLFSTLTLLFLLSCGGSSQKERENLKVEIEGLKSELQKYKDKYGEFPILNPSKGKFGIWKVDYYVDDFGEKTKEGYVKADLYGTFSNSATTNSDLRVEFVIDKESIRIQLYEYGGNHPIKGEGFLSFKAKDKEGKVYNFKTYNRDNGNNTVVDMDYKFDDTTVRNLLLKGGEILFVGETGGRVSSEYKFRIKNADYLSEAISHI